MREDRSDVLHTCNPWRIQLHAAQHFREGAMQTAEIALERSVAIVPLMPGGMCINSQTFSPAAAARSSVSASQANWSSAGVWVGWPHGLSYDVEKNTLLRTTSRWLASLGSRIE